MIYLKRLNGEPFVLNCELIENIDATPDTVISMTTGKKIVVLESIDEVVVKTLKYKREILKSYTDTMNIQRNEV